MLTMLFIVVFKFQVLELLLYGLLLIKKEKWKAHQRMQDNEESCQKHSICTACLTYKSIKSGAGPFCHADTTRSARKSLAIIPISHLFSIKKSFVVFTTLIWSSDVMS